jgi:hypothetical protein
VITTNSNNLTQSGPVIRGAYKTVQGLINCLSQKEIFPADFIKEVKDGVLLILHLHSSIASRLGFKHRMFDETLADDLFVPGEANACEMMNLFSFDRQTIDALSEQLGIAPNTFDQFVYDWKTKGLNFTYHDANPLFQQPFITVGEEFILVMPTTELICLNDFIISLAKKHQCLDQLLFLYAQQGTDELYPYFGRMHWEFEKFTFSQTNKPDLFLLQESLWQVDANKLVYVAFMTEHPDHTVDHRHRDTFSTQFTKRVEHESALIKKAYPGYQLLLVGVIHKSRVLGLFGLALELLKNSEYHIFFSILELQVLTRVWKFDRLTLWKYAKYLHLAEDKIHFAPLNTHYSKYNWYIRNDESFSDPDHEAYNGAAFGFEIESDIRRKGLVKLDKIGIPFPSTGTPTYVQCYRKEEYYPVYISQAVNYGYLHSCLLKYTCPIWFMPAERTGIRAEVYINGLLYWLNELYDYVKDYVSQLGQQPIIFVVSMDKAFDELKDLDSYDDQPVNIKYTIDISRRKIDMLIPVEIVQYTSSPYNQGEQYLMSFVLDMLEELMQALGIGNKLPPDEHLNIIETAIPRGNQKMIIMATGDRDLKVAEIDIDDERTIPKSDISFLLENQVAWLNYPAPIPVRVSDPKEKIKLFNDLVALHFRKLEAQLKKYDGLSLLVFLMRRHEALIQAQSFRKINYPVKQSCYSKYYDVYKEFAETEGNLNFSSLAARVLIEFVACLMPTGELITNDDDADMLLAHAGQIIHYGSISDEIKYGIRDMEVGLLPSGRIGINRSAGKKAFDEFTDHVYEEEFDSYTEDFSQSFYRRNRKPGEVKLRDDYYEHVNTIFKEEWGIGLYDLPAVSHFIAYHLYGQDKSVAIFNEQEFLKTIKKETDFTAEELQSYIQQLTFLQRPDILQPPEGYAQSEIYPWRYNRKLSYLMKPIIRIKNGDDYQLIISARHLWMASENLVGAFGKGILKVKKEYKRIGQLIADQNGIKGKEYRQEVYEWLIQNTFTTVIPHEVRISPRGYFRASSDLGDIDILVIDSDKKIIYSIECKNTHQSKVAYEYRVELDNYLGIPPKKGLISKHMNRDKWLQENKAMVLTKLGLSEDYRIYSLVVSHHVLPTKFLASVDITLLSFYELRKSGLPDFSR